MQEIKCTLQEFLDLADKPDGPILNALSFPLSLAGVSPSPLSSDVEAYLATKGRPFCKDEERYPSSDMLWGTTTHNGGRHWQHLDTGGVATVFKVAKGLKWVVVARDPIPEFLDQHPNYLPFSSSSAFTGQFAIDEPISPAWAYEAILLRPGDWL